MILKEKYFYCLLTFCYLLSFYFIHYFLLVDEFDNFLWDIDFMNC